MDPIDITLHNALSSRIGSKTLALVELVDEYEPPKHYFVTIQMILSRTRTHMSVASIHHVAFPFISWNRWEATDDPLKILSVLPQSAGRDIILDHLRVLSDQVGLVRAKQIIHLCSLPANQIIHLCSLPANQTSRMI
jgi:hypothetical protein